MKYRYKLGFIGAGNMAKAIANGIINANILKQNEVIMSDLHGGQTYNGINIIEDNSIILNECENIILAIKPQIFNEIYNTFNVSNARCVISIMAGVKKDKIASAFKNVKNIIRVMPNLPCSVKAGMAALTKSNDEEANNFAKSIFDSIGKSIFLDEDKFDSVTSISGSGPAYVYYFIKSMIDGGIKGGLSEEEAKLLTLQTFIGGVKMVENSNDDLTTLIDKVCSKGGTTIQAIDTFNQNNLDKIIIDGIDKCRLRSEELSK